MIIPTFIKKYICILSAVDLDDSIGAPSLAPPEVAGTWMTLSRTRLSHQTLIQSYWSLHRCTIEFLSMPQYGATPLHELWVLSCSHYSVGHCTIKIMGIHGPIHVDA